MDTAKTRQARDLPEPQLPLAPLGPATAERFKSKYRVDKAGCWLWTSTLSHNGYARYSIKNRAYRAHRLAYETYIGPIPNGLQIDHLCRVRNCVNPMHMEPVTNRENTLRGENFIANQVRLTHCPKGHPYDEENTAYTPSRPNWRYCKTCRRKPREAVAARVGETE